MRGMYCSMVLCMTIQLSIAACNLSGSSFADLFRAIDSSCTEATLTGTIPTASVSLTWSGTSSSNSLTLTSSSPSNTNSITVTINNIKQIYFQNSNWGGSNNYLNTDGNITLLSITSSIVTNTRFTIPSSSNIAWNITGSQFTGVSFIENQSSCSGVSISNSTLRTNSLQYVNPSCDVSIQSSTIVNHAFIINLPGQNILVQGGINGRSILRSSSIKRSPASSSGQPDGGIIMVSDTDFYDNILYYPASYAGNITVVGSAFRSQGTTTNNALINAIYTSVSGCQFYNVTFPLGTVLSDHIYVQSSTFDSCTTKVSNTGNTQGFTVIWSGFELTMIDSMVTNTNVNNSNWMNVPGAVFSFNVRMNNCTFNNNYGNMGAAVYGQHLNMTSCTFQNNVASQLGGAVFVMNTGDSIDVNSTYINNFVNSSIGAGGAIYSQNNASTSYHSSFQSNSATYGSAIYTVGARLYNCTFSNHRNNGPIGYGVISGTTSVIASGCTYVSNAVPAIFGGSTTLVNLQSCSFRENSNGDLSGGLIDVNGGYVQATYTVFSGNNVTDVIRAGSVTLGYVDIIGDIFNSSAVTVTSGGSIYNCHFYANGSIGYSITSSGGVNITDCKFSEFSNGLQSHYGDHRLMRSTFTPETPLIHLDNGGTLTTDNITLLCFIRTPDNSRYLIYNAPDTASYVSMATFDCTFSSSIIPTTSTTLEISTTSTPNDITPAEALHFITKNTTLPWTAIYNTISQLFSNPASNATLTLSLPSLSLSAYDLTRYHTDTSYQSQSSPLNDTTDNVTAAVARVTQESIDASRKESSGQRGPAAMVFMEYKYDSGGFSSQPPSNFSGRVYGLTVSDSIGNVVKVSGRSERINITIPARGVSTREELLNLNCSYYNETTDTWSNDGCETERNFDDFSLLCSCNHLTNFTIGSIAASQGSPLSETRENNKSVIIGVVVGSVALIALLVVILFVVSRRRRARAQVKDLEIPMETVDASKHVTLEEKIGEGRHSTVYRGLQSGTTQVAVKKMKSDKSEIDKESSIVKSMHHPNVVQYSSHVRDHSGDTWIMFESMECDLLTKLISSGSKLDTPDRYHVMLQIAKALSYLQSLDIIHCDIAARNVLIKDNLVKSCDYGSAMKRGDKVTSNDTNEQAHRWMAPEVSTKREYSFASDIWSYGVSFWEVMNDGQRPYEEMSEREVTQYVVEGGTLSKEGSEAHDIIMNRCWTKERRGRITCQEIVTDLKLHYPSLSV